MRRSSSSVAFGVALACWSVAGVLVLSIGGGCGSEATPDPNTSDTGASSSGSSGGFGEGGGAIEDALPPSDVLLNAETACAQASAVATLQPLDMFITLDHTASMAPDCPLGSAGTSLWCRATNALSTYFKSASSTGNGAALQFFNLNNLCDGTGEDVSVVPGGITGYQTLPSSAFDTKLDDDAPVGGFGTRTESAIRGLVAFTGRPANRVAGRSTIGIIVTDGDPTQCDTTPAGLSGLLQTHFTATGVRTFLVGMTGADDATLEGIAAGGNAPLHATNINGLTNTCGASPSPCRHWNVGNGDGNVLVEALKAIQSSAVGCNLKMPSTDGGTIDLNQVKVEYSPGGNPPAQELQRVNDTASCVANGFYYDDNTTPTVVSLCPQVCTTVQADPSAKVNVLFGCIIPGGSSSSSGNPK